jgi:hypothetical protein
MCSDFYFVCGAIHYWLVYTAMPIPKLVGAKAKCATQNLISKTDSKKWSLGIKGCLHK